MKKTLRDQLNRLHGNIPSPKNAIKRIADALTPNDAYRKGLNGAQAAWAARKYKGHRVPPPEYKKDMLVAGIMRGGTPNAGLYCIHSCILITTHSILPQISRKKLDTCALYN
ncbi:hypothetical protein C8J57DRAFT_1070118 [Mycena rebaudengoi]|nr:hypothetical protein C8J57DRAFT_1070118 [Mycena rebaudengoi]